MIEVKAYKCDYCNKVSRTVQGMRAHEKHCGKNPIKNRCFNCINGCMLDVIKDVCNPFGELFKIGEMVPWCIEHDRKIFDGYDSAYFFNCETRCYDNGESIPIPYTCQDFISSGKSGFTIIK